MTRTTYDLSHFQHTCGQIGRLQTLSVIPVIGGDSLDISLDGILRLAATRKEITSECQWDICAFYVKHRHLCDPFTWAQFMREGPHALAVPWTGLSVAAPYRDPYYLGIRQCGATINPMLVRGYNFIYQRYFAVPASAQNGEMNFSNQKAYLLNYYPTNESYAANFRNYGTMAARLPHILNGFNIVNSVNAGGFATTVDASDFGVTVNDSAPNVGRLDVRDLAAIQSRYKTVQEAAYFASFYDDLMEKRYGVSNVNSDADPRPDMLGRQTGMMSGHDIDGTDDATLGQFAGKTLGRVNFSTGRKFFAEHGNVWIMAVLRYPLVHTKEQHPLLAQATPDVNLLQGDANMWNEQKPVPFDPGNWLAGGSIYTPQADFQQPYGQEYRYQPNRTHPNYEAIPGYPYSTWDTTSGFQWYYYFDNEYADTFQTSQLAHWQMHAQLKAMRYSHLPSPADSIMAGA